MVKNGLNRPAILAPVVVAVMPPSAWISTRETVQVRKEQEIATIPVAYARLPVSDARTRPTAAISMAHISPTPRPGMSALVWLQTSRAPLAAVIVPMYNSSRGTSTSSRHARVSAMYLLSG